ncbi:MAG: hypothetical protein GY847_23685 [Proteobacteria bacterium]|nr:hypothetical protein [Pseudomonadota bacterium]
MQKREAKGDKSDHQGNLDAAAWYNTDADDNTYLSVVIGNQAGFAPKG